MSRHTGVSCDSCMKNGFTGIRYKCLVCCDYDLCSACYEAKLVTSRHKADHAMQCLLTKSDVEVYFGGEESSGVHQQSFTCPYCGQFGLTNADLLNHIDEEHPDNTLEVVCPVCVATPGGDPNHMTDDLISHLLVDHHGGQKPDANAEGDGSQQQSHRAALDRYVLNRPQLRRADALRNVPMDVSTSSLSSSQSNAATATGREPADPVSGGITLTELLSQLSNARSRAAAVRNVSAQLQQLELQLQSTSRQQLEGMPVRTGASSSSAHRTSAGAHRLVILANPNSSASAPVPSSGDNNNHNNESSASADSTRTDSNNQYLLANSGVVFLSELDQEIHESELADRSLFVQELLLLAKTAADEGLPCENPPLDMSEIPSCAVTTQPVLNSVGKPATNSDTVVNCSAKPGYLRGKNSGGLLRSGVGQSTGNSQHNSSSRDVATLPGAKR